MKNCQYSQTIDISNTNLHNFSKAYMLIPSLTVYQQYQGAVSLKIRSSFSSTKHTSFELLYLLNALVKCHSEVCNKNKGHYIYHDCLPVATTRKHLNSPTIQFLSHSVLHSKSCSLCVICPTNSIPHSASSSSIWISI